MVLYCSVPNDIKKKVIDIKILVNSNGCKKKKKTTTLAKSVMFNTLSNYILKINNQKARDLSC